ncbi:MAG: hypothetical protein M5U28_50820 [Sandaracinaceae bacterium]|nr:hypothetical protein [Sandaracinaceae bacterium]
MLLASIGVALAACVPASEYCVDTCALAGNGTCEDGRSGAASSECATGTDCRDCGPYAPAEADSPYRITSQPGPPVEVSSPPQETCVPTEGDACEEWSCASSRELARLGGGALPMCEGGLGRGCTSTLVGCPTVPSDSSAYWECRDGDQGIGCYFAGSSSLVAGETVTHCGEYGVCDDGTPVQQCVRMPVYWRPEDPNLADLFFNESLCASWFQIGDWRKDCGSCNSPCNLSIDEARDPCESQDGCGGACPEGSSCIDGICVGEGALRFTLQWSSANDLDLYVQTPGGNTISYRMRSADGGMLDRDDTDGGANSVENVFFTSPLNGTYTYWVDNYSGGAASFNLSAYKGGTRAALNGGSVESGGESARYTIDFP